MVIFLLKVNIMMFCLSFDWMWNPIFSVPRNGPNALFSLPRNGVHPGLPRGYHTSFSSFSFQQVLIHPVFQHVFVQITTTPTTNINHHKHWNIDNFNHIFTVDKTADIYSFVKLVTLAVIQRFLSCLCVHRTAKINSFA